MTDLLLLLMVVILAYLTGKRVLISIGTCFEGIIEQLLLSVSCGLGIIAVVMFLFGVLGILYSYLILPMFLSLTILSLLYDGKNEYLDIRERLPKANYHQPLIWWVIISVFVGYVFFNLVRCMSPVINGDSLSAYLQVPSLYVHHHGIYDILHTGDDSLPQNIMMLNALGLILHSDSLSQLLNGWLLSLLCTLAIYVLARKFVSRKIALIAAIVFYTMPALSWLIYSTKIDIGYTMFELCFWVLYFKWLKKDDNRLLYIAAIFLGFSIGSKYHALITLALSVLFTLFAMIVKKHSFKSIFSTLFVYGSIALIIGSPSYILNYVYTSDPFYPFLKNPSTGSGEDINQYVGIFDFIRFQYNMIFGKDYFIANRPFIGKPIGFLAILFIPFLLFGRKLKTIFANYQFRTHAVVIMTVYYTFLSFIIFKSVWPFSRHFLPAIGLMCVVNSIGIQKSLRWLNIKFVYLIVFVSMLATIVLFNVNVKQTKYYFMYAFGQVGKTEFLNKQLFNNGTHMNYQMIEFVKTLDESAQIATLDFGNAYYIPRPFVKHAYYYEILDINLLISRMKKDGLTHIYYSDNAVKYLADNFNGGNKCILLQGIEKHMFTEVYQVGDQHLFLLP